MKRKPLFFTLVELLVVIAIIAILAGMFLPALNKARLKAQKIACKSNLKNIALAHFMYGDDNNGFMPNQQTDDYDDEDHLWFGLLNVYVRNKKVFVECRMRTAPLSGLSSANSYWYYTRIAYGANHGLIWAQKLASTPSPTYKNTDVNHPSKKIYYADSRSGNGFSDSSKTFSAWIILGGDPATSNYATDFRHNLSADAILGDGHVSSLRRMASEIYYYENFQRQTPSYNVQKLRDFSD